MTLSTPKFLAFQEFYESLGNPPDVIHAQFRFPCLCVALGFGVAPLVPYAKNPDRVSVVADKLDVEMGYLISGSQGEAVGAGTCCQKPGACG
jgi:hypothetical protein